MGFSNIFAWECPIQGQDVILHRFNDTKIIGLDGKEYSYFDFYTSGDGGRQTHKTKSMVAKKLLQLKILIVFVIAMILISIYKLYAFLTFDSNSNFQTPATKQKVENNTSASVSSASTSSKNSLNLNFKDRALVKILYKNEIYFIGDIKFNETQFQVLKKELNIFILTRQKIFNNYQYIYCLFPSDVAVTFNLIH